MSFGDLWLSAALGVLYVLIAVPAALPRAGQMRYDLPVGMGGGLVGGVIRRRRLAPGMATRLDISSRIDLRITLNPV